VPHMTRCKPQEKASFVLCFFLRPATHNARIGADISNSTTAVIRHIMLCPFGESII